MQKCIQIAFIINWIKLKADIRKTDDSTLKKNNNERKFFVNILFQPKNYHFQQNNHFMQSKRLIPALCGLMHSNSQYQGQYLHPLEEFIDWPPHVLQYGPFENLMCVKN